MQAAAPEDKEHLEAARTAADADLPAWCWLLPCLLAVSAVLTNLWFTAYSVVADAPFTPGKPPLQKQLRGPLPPFASLCHHACEHKYFMIFPWLAPFVGGRSIQYSAFIANLNLTILL